LLPICLFTLTVGGYGKEVVWQAVEASLAEPDYLALPDSLIRDA
jgi:hypothetical protein